MTTTKIHSVTCTCGFTLVVYYTISSSWQFRVISPSGTIFGESKIYYTAYSAQKAGREWIKQEI
jgi:hypothetical protein